MPLSPSDHLGPYEIVEPIGKGGMGQVYRAHDSRVGREVAIKTSLDQTLGGTVAGNASNAGSMAQALRVCLQKDPRQRASDIHDVRLALEGAFETRATEAASQAVLPPAPLWRRALPSVVSAAAMAVLLLAVAWASWPSPARPVIRSVYRPPEGVALEAEYRDAMAVAPDGAFVVYKSGDTFRIRSRDSLQERVIQVETANFVGPDVSPDGQSLVYWTFADENQAGPIP